MGWQTNNPFSGSLTDTLGSYLSGVTSIDDIKNNTWRKTLNNLLYIYKSKGTKNSVRGLLNIYGYPPDVLQFQEFGGVTSEADIGNEIINDNLPTSSATPYVDLNLDTHTGSFSFTSTKSKLYRYIFNGKQNRILNLDWWMDNANINSLEFVYKHVETTQTQTILRSSGSGTQTLWDLRLIPSSTGNSSSFQFRLNNSQVADTAIGSRGFSMSSAFLEMNDGELYNVMLQRMTGSSSGPGTIQYRLHAAIQKENIIEKYSYVSMSISGAMAGGTDAGGLGFFANQNWQSSGSRGTTTSSNLFVGETLSGSLSEIRGWSTALSASKFRQHTLNKFSSVGNTLLSHCNELVYHFKLNENYSSGSVSASSQTLKIIDSAPTVTYSDYSITKPGTFFTGSFIYGYDNIDAVRLTLQDNTNKENDNSILINPNNKIIGDLSYNQSAVESLTAGKKEKFKVSSKLEIFSSPQSHINNFILDKLSGFNLEKKYGSPTNYYSESYFELDKFKNDFFNCYPMEISTNKFIRSHESMFNQSISEGLTTLVPARSTFSDNNNGIGVEIKQTILEKYKYENKKHSVETNPNTATGSHSVNINLSETIYNSVKEGTAQGAPTTSGSSILLPYSQSISLGNNYQTSSMGGDVNYRDNQYITPGFLQPDGYVTTIENPYSASISPLPTYGGTGIETSKNGLINYALDANKSFENVHKNWGTSSSDVQHINYAGGVNTDGTYNTYAIETRFHFYSVGDSEYYSSSFESNGNGSSDFTNSNRFYNRLLIDNDFNADSTYESFINGGLQTGRVMGKTRYFSSSTAADGTTTDFYPRNHVSKFSNPFKDNMNNGTKNTNPGLLNVQAEDYSTASFYRVKVTGGENQIYVRSGNPTTDNDDRIIY